MKQENTLKVLDCITIAISLIALAISYLGYSNSRYATEVAEKSLNFTERTFNNQFAAIWKIQVSDENLFFDEMSEGQVVQGIKVYTPTEIGGDEWILPLRTKEYSITRFDSRLQKIVDKKFGKIESGYHAMAKLAFPIVVETVFSTQGKNYTDRSIYAVQFNSIFMDQSNSMPSLRYTGTSFIKRLHPSDDVIEVLDSNWHYVISSWNNTSEDRVRK